MAITESLRLAGVTAALLVWFVSVPTAPSQAGPATPADDQAQRAFAIPVPPLQGMPRLRLWATYYYTHEAKPAVGGIRFRDRRGRSLSDPVDARDWCLAAVQGGVRAPWSGTTVTLSLGGEGARLLVDCARILGDRVRGAWVGALGRSYFARARGPLGDGVLGYRLVPLRTIAVDPSVIPFGAVLYIPEARGVTLEVAPGVWVKHDGYFFAADEGPNIKGEHVDMFCGMSAESCFPDFATRSGGHSFDAYIIRDRSISTYLSKAHRPDKSRLP
jgi:3D (Asp-Asp-Asp) domain-containing protein